MDVVLIQPKFRLTRNPDRRASLPKGLLSVATPLDKAGFKVKIIDQRVDPNWQRNLLSELKTKPICVGITSMTGPEIWWALKASEVVKLNSDVPVVWGGVHASILPQQTIENPYIDIVVQGEGEETFFELVTSLRDRKSLSEIKGIWYKDNGQIKQTISRPFIDLNQQSPLSYHLVDLKRHMSRASGKDCLGFETSRGCPFDCAFCYNTTFRKKQWRALTPEQTLSRMKHIIHKYGIKGFIFSDDNFFVDPHRAYTILEQIARQKLDITWAAGDIRLDMLSQLDDDYLSTIEKSGCLSLVIGVESGSQRVADIMRKGIDVYQSISVNHRLIKYKMQPRYCFVIGIPGETDKDLAETASLMSRLVSENPKASVGVNIYAPYPGTELFEYSIQHGFQVPQKLEQWTMFSWINRRLAYPWLSSERKKLLQMLSFCGVFLGEDRNLKIFSDVSPFISWVARLYSPVAKRRIDRLSYRLMPELRIAELLGYKGY
jgi:anaerobic magnesium-protoporphyrin IX monomethyl ester cyclase